MSNRYDPQLKQAMQQHAPHSEGKSGRNVEVDGQSSENQSHQALSSARSEKFSKSFRKWLLYILGAEYLRKVDFRKNLPFILLVVAMVIFLIYLNLLTLSRQKKLEVLDKERIELNDKYTQIMEKRELLNVDTTQQRPLIEIFRKNGFVDDSSLVYDIQREGKERGR